MKTCITCNILKSPTLFNKRKNECKVCQKRRFKEWASKPENILRQLVNNARYRSAKLGLEFGITYKDLHLPMNCPVLGIPIFVGDEVSSENSPSIDRLNPEKGYIPGNCLVISHLANRIKTNASTDQIRKVADWLDAVTAEREL